MWIGRKEEMGGESLSKKKKIKSKGVTDSRGN